MGYTPANGGDAGDVGSIPGSGRPAQGENGNPHEYSCLDNPRDRGVGELHSMGLQKNWTWLSD